MTGGPHPFARDIWPLDTALEQAGPLGWEGLMRDFLPARVSENFDPGEDMKLVLAAFYNTAEGRRIVEWLWDLTVRAPYPHVGASNQSAAIAAAKHEARVAVGLSLKLAIEQGQKLWNEKRSQTHAASS